MNIRKIEIRGKVFWQVETTPHGQKRRTYKTSKNKQTLIDYCNAKKQFELADVSGMLAKKYTISQLADIQNALEILPAGQTLTSIVERYNIYYSAADICAVKDEFLEVKFARNIAPTYKAHLTKYLNAFCGTFKNFESATPQNIIKWIKNLPYSAKTKSLYKGAILQFFKFAVRKDYINQNPFDKIALDDLPAILEVERGILTVEQTKIFLEKVKKDYPQFLNFYIAAFFTGIRRAELERLTFKNFDIRNKKIYLPFNVQKTARADVLEDFESNLWQMLDKYKEYGFTAPTGKIRDKINKSFDFKIPHNFARHSFATYHFSKYLDVRRTCAITRHSERMLKRYYLAQRVEQMTGAKYFEIIV